MTQLYPRLTLTLILTFLTNLIHSQPIKAQITPDNSLGAESSTVRQDTIKNLPSDVIEGGASRGSNLFHSFQEFNVNEGRGAYFANPAVIQNIFSRVTGGNISHILGTLGVLGNANLYLINPNGIIFGPNARLDVRGAFFGSTADGLLFNNNYDFSASNPTAPPLLTVDIPLGVRFRENTGDINSTANLATPSDLTLQGANVNLTGSVVAGGNLRLEALDTLTIRDSLENPFLAVSGQDLLIQGNNIDIFALNNAQSAIASYGNLTLKSANPVLGDAHYYSGGSFSIEKLDGSLGELLSIDDPVILSLGDVSFDAYIGSSLHIFSAGSVNIPNFVRIIAADPVNGIVETITLSDGTTVNVDGQNEPTLDIRAGVDPSVIGGTFFNPFNFFPFAPNIISPPNFTPSASSADINIGTIILADFFDNPLAGKILLTNQYQPNSTLNGNISISTTLGEIATQTGNANSGGSVIVDSKGEITINGIVEASASQGIGGNVTFIAQDNITFNSEVSIFANGVLSGSINLKANEDIFVTGGQITSNVLSSVNNTVPSETGGNIEISAKSLFLADGARLSASTFGQGNAGTINITARKTVSLDENLEVDTFIFNNVQSDAVGNSGGIKITTGSLFVANGAQIQSLTRGQGNSGKITVIARDTVSFDGNDGSPSGAFSTVQEGAVGNSGGIDIIAKELLLTNRAQLNSNTKGQGDSGNISIEAQDQVSLSNSIIISEISEEGGIGNGGNIKITTGSLSLKDGSSLLADTENQGNAGNIVIEARDNVTLEGNGPGALDPTIIVPSQISTTVDSNAVGEGGDIKISTGNLSVTDEGFISTNTSGKGNAGDINITATDSISITNNGKISADISGIGRAGDINITATNSISVTKNGGISNDTSGVGNAGNLTIATENLLVDSSQVSASTFGQGDAGNLTIRASESVELRGEIPGEDGEFGFPGGLLAQIDRTGEGRGGNLTIETERLSISDGSKVQVATFGQGDAGELLIRASEIDVFNRPDVDSNFSTGIFAGVLLDPRTTTPPRGNGGNLTIETKRLSISDGAEISASTFGKGNAGAIKITATDSILLTGESSQGFLSSINSEVRETSEGNSQGITINTSNLTLENGTSISASTRGRGNAGDITIKATENISLSGTSFSDTLGRDREVGGILTFSQTVGNAGSVTINTPQLTISDGAGIEAFTSGEGRAGNITVNTTESIILNTGTRLIVETSDAGIAGDININATNVSLTNGASIESDSASTAQGDGGDITINATGAVSLRCADLHRVHDHQRGRHDDLFRPAWLRHVRQQPL